MKKNIVGKTMALVMALTTAGSVAACGGGEGARGTVDDAKTINVRLFKGGYGVDWVYELVDNFEKAYEAEGYKVNILTPSSDMRSSVVVTELMQGYEKTKVDLYITGNVSPETVGADGDYGVLVEDVEELVYNQKAIGYDGVYEEKTVLEKMHPEYIPEMTDDYDGTFYYVPYVATAAGFVVNTKKLAEYGLALPKTTNELLDCFRKIYLGHNGVENSEESGVFPLTYVPGSSNGYTTCWTGTMVAQYDYEQFVELMSMQTVAEDGTVTPMSEDGYKVFNYKGIEEMLTVAIEAFDVNIASYGTTTQTLDQAQAAIMRDGGAVFMANGDWMLNEVKLNYKKNLDDIAFINFPVISALGTKLFGAGTSYNLSDEKCEELLSYAIGLVDAGKTAAEIVTDVQTNKNITLAVEDAEEIVFARGLYWSRGEEHGCYITKGSPKKDIAALLLRMMASEDCAKSIAELANATSAYTHTVQTDAKYEFVNQASYVKANANAYPVINGSVQGYRKKLQAGSGRMATISHEPSSIAQKGLSVYDGDGHMLAGMDYSYYRQQAQIMQAADYATAQTRWTEWKKNDK